jgi:ABC-type Fe3+-hydroxamate transport system substrate-binding protein
MRIISLVPSATETLLLWGTQPIACTRFCEQPSLRHVGGTKDPDIAAIVALAPDLVVMCDQENRREDAELLTAAGLPIHVIHLLAIEENAPEMDRLATAIGRPDRIGTCQIAPATQVEPTGQQIRAFVPIWKRPWMTINGATYGSTLLQSLGVANIAEHHQDRYPTLQPEEIMALQPDVVLAPTEPYPFASRHQSILEEFAPVVFVDGQDLFWWGARAPQARNRLETVIDQFRYQS